MDIRNAFDPVRGTISVVRREALRGLVLVVVFCGPGAAAKQSCVDSLSSAKQGIDLDTCRPAPVSSGEKNMVLKSLPPEGEVTELAGSERQKLTDLAAVLRLHRREGVYAVKVISVPQAWTGLHGRAVLLISLPALRLLDSEELQALVAHEVGHEYLWQEYAAAQSEKNSARLRQLELACDRISVLTLQRIGVKPDRLITGLEKVFRFNRERFGRALNESSYPSIKTRRDLVKKMSSTSRLAEYRLPIQSDTSFVP